MVKIRKKKNNNILFLYCFFCNIKIFFIDNTYLIPLNIKINIKKNKIYFKSLLGKVNFIFSKDIFFIIIYNKLLFVSLINKDKKKIIKLYLTLIKINIKGILKGFKEILIIKGLGFKFLIKNNKIFLKLGFSHNIIIIIPKKIKIITRNNKIIFSSYNYIFLTQFIYYLRSFKKINKYKEKGLLLQNEKIVIKEGKKNKK
jgi:large subunit ribosomal protein L6